MEKLLEEIKTLLIEADGAMVGITTLKGRQLNHYLLTNKFPKVDFLKSLVEVKKLAIEDLEKEAELSEF